VSNETNDSDALNSLCKLADSYLIIPNRLDEARAIWNVIVKDFKLDKKDIAFAYYKMAEIERRDKTRVDLSLKIFTLIDLAIQLDPENEYYYSKRAEIFQDHGEFGKAENDYSNAIKVSKADSAFLHYWNRGYMKRLQGNIDGAIKDYNEAINQNSDIYELYKSRAKAYLMKKDYLSAYNDFFKAYDLFSFEEYSLLKAYELAILLEKQNEASGLKRNCQDDGSSIVDYLNLLYEIVIERKTEFNLEAIKAKLKDYNFEIDWSFDIAKDLLVVIKNETATRLLTEYEQLINKHNEQFKAV
jgi:tetratricopeptide (TPR) repeat protein